MVVLPGLVRDRHGRHHRRSRVLPLLEGVPRRAAMATGTDRAGVGVRAEHAERENVR